MSEAPTQKNHEEIRTLDQRTNLCSALLVRGKQSQGSAIVHEGIRLAYIDRGQGEPAFVFVHGWTSNRSAFSPQIEHFSKTNRVVAIDLRGHGDSDKPKGKEYSIAAYADDVAYVIEQLGIERAVVIGHSMGGPVVLQLAAFHPDRVVALVLLDPSPFTRTPEARQVASAMVEAMEAGNQEPRRKYIERFFLPTSDRKFVEETIAGLLAAPVYVAAPSIRSVLAFDAPSVAARCHVPILHLAGTPGLNPTHLMSQWVPNVVNGRTVGAGHFIQLEATEQVNSMIEGFLRHYVLGVRDRRAA